MRPLHILAGLLGIVSGALALHSAKGSRLHRRSGIVFVYAMLLMSATGALLAALTPQPLSVVAGVLTFYLVLTGVLAVRQPVLERHWIDGAAMLAAEAVALAAAKLGVDAGRAGGREAAQAGTYFVFAAVALLAALGDMRLLLGRRLQGAARLARHLWRLGFALFVAVGSFFLGQPQVFPTPLRASGLLALPVLWVLLAIPYWLARVLFRQRHPHASPGRA
jgi:uncharacterized membrane protein